MGKGSRKSSVRRRGADMVSQHIAIHIGRHELERNIRLFSRGNTLRLRDWRIIGRGDGDGNRGRGRAGGPIIRGELKAIRPEIILPGKIGHHRSIDAQSAVRGLGCHRIGNRISIRVAPGEGDVFCRVFSRGDVLGIGNGSLVAPAHRGVAPFDQPSAVESKLIAHDRTPELALTIDDDATRWCQDRTRHHGTSVEGDSAIGNLDLQPAGMCRHADLSIRIQTAGQLHNYRANHGEITLAIERKALK